MKLVILKFGGTSLDTSEHRQAAATIVKDKVTAGFFPVVVVSAMGRIGEPYSTDTLHNLLPENTSEDVSDFLANCGEMISASLFSAELQNLGLKARPVTGWQAGIITDKFFRDAQVLEINTGTIEKLIHNNIVPVVCGFQGITPDGELTTLGRGGSDTTSALLAQALKAESLEIYKDVDGIFTANPHQVNDARLIKVINYEELAEITGNGAQVVNNRAALIAAGSNIPIGIGNTFTGKTGTLVKIVKQNRLITSLTSRSNLLLVRIATAAENRLSEIFPLFSLVGLSLDFITVDNCHISFVIEQNKIAAVQEVLTKIEDDYEVTELYSKISLVGSGMTGQPGVMAKISRILNENMIPVILATDSYSTISVLVKSEYELLALQKLHQALISEEV
ncbi:MAG: aspartate kinase [Candidatus Cloacimonetes bacterium]|nr:aspartate kinase [Candidatus Cloacimonadota bacterium]